MLGYTFTGAPLAIKDKIVIGVATGEAGIRGWVQAFDPANGNNPVAFRYGSRTWRERQRNLGRR